MPAMRPRASASRLAFSHNVFAMCAYPLDSQYFLETLNISHLYEFCSIESSAQRCALALSPLTAGAAHANPRWAWRPCRGE